MKLLGFVNVDGLEVELRLDRYISPWHSVPAIQAFSVGEDGSLDAFGRLSVNPAGDCQSIPWTAHVNPYGENDGLAVGALRSGLFEDLHRPLDRKSVV